MGKLVSWQDGGFGCVVGFRLTQRERGAEGEKGESERKREGREREGAKPASGFCPRIGKSSYKISKNWVVARIGLTPERDVLVPTYGLREREGGRDAVV